MTDNQKKTFKRKGVIERLNKAKGRLQTRLPEYSNSSRRPMLSEQ
jgi:hypothetical protein